MRNVLSQALQGLAISEARIVDDYLRLAFGERVRLSVFNAFTLTPMATVDVLVGKVVAEIEEAPTSIAVRFLDGGEIMIDMSPTGYRGPEAIMLHRVGQPMVVWEWRQYQPEAKRDLATRMDSPSY
jgi:hypothetical protein